MNRHIITLGFIGLYIALDAVSFIHPLLGLNITPWNPAPALGLVFLLRRGPDARITLVATVLLSEWLVRGPQHACLASLISALVLATGYVLLGEVIRRAVPQLGLLDDRASLVRWLVLVVVGTLVNSLVYVSLMVTFDLLPAARWQAGVLRFWVGDAVGIAVVMPLLWWLSSARGRIVLKMHALRWETLGYTLLGVAAVWVAFVVGDDEGFMLFYVLLLPIIWAAARQGIAGAIISAALLQFEVIAAVRILDYNAITVAELQVLALMMALVGFFVGCVVDEQRRTSAELRQSLRLAAAGEMAGALAHELNQPLTALSIYASACAKLLGKGESGDRLNATIQGMLRESARTGDIVRRLRDFFRTGATKLESVGLRQVVEDALTVHRITATNAGVMLTVGEIPDVTLLADRLQLEVVLRNLLSNAFDAVAEHDLPRREIAVGAEVLPGNRVSICVEDSGRGLRAEYSGELFEPFQTTKSSGMGLGLAISRAMVETHGGTLNGEVADHGIFRLVLPIQDGLKSV